MRGIAWSTPAIAAAGAAPAFAASSICTPAGAPAAVTWARTAYPTGYCTGTQDGKPIHLLLAGQTYTFTYTLTVSGATVQTGILSGFIMPYNPARTAGESPQHLAWTSTAVTSSAPSIFQVGAGSPTPATDPYATDYPITQIAPAPPGTYTFTLTIVVPTIIPQSLSGAIMPGSISVRSDCTQVVSLTSDYLTTQPNRLWAPEGARNSSTGLAWCTT